MDKPSGTTRGGVVRTLMVKDFQEMNGRFELAGKVPKSTVINSRLECVIPAGTGMNLQ